MTSVGSLRVPEASSRKATKHAAAPSHRHAAPSAPWPWIDIEDDVDPVQLSSPLPSIVEKCTHISCNDCWKGYPQSLYPNWTPGQVEKSKIGKAITDYKHDIPCAIYQIDVDDNGLFHVPTPGNIISDDNNINETWKQIVNSELPANNRVRALFVEKMTGPILQMLGTKYNIEPFFFSSSLNWIPSRYVEEVIPGEGDHITISLTFVRSISSDNTNHPTTSTPNVPSGISTASASGESDLLAKHIINTHAPLTLGSNRRIIFLDLLSIHLIRRKQGSVIVSYHPDGNLPTTTASFLQERIRFAGQSVYWQSIFQKSPDPTFVLLTFVWHAIYAWDEAMEHLYAHICRLEAIVMSTSEMALTQELHIIRAHHLHHASLLDDFRKAIIFLRDTANPALEALPEEEREYNKDLMRRECANLLKEVERLELGRRMQDKRLKNVMDLVFSSINILDSKRMQKMTEAAAKDSAAMKQIAYLTMIFLPASFVAAVFGMNVQEIVPYTHGTLSHYVETAVPFTLLTIWVIIASQNRYIFPPDLSFWGRLAWPILLAGKLIISRPFTMWKKNTDAEVPQSSAATVITLQRKKK